MRPRLPFRLQAGLANTPLWLAGAACVSAVLFLNVADGLRATRAGAQDAVWRTLPDRATQLAAAIGRQPARGAESLNVWLDDARRDGRGQIAWLRVVDSTGATEARSGVVIAPVDWNGDRRIQSGERGYRIVETPAGMIAVAAAPVVTHARPVHSLIQLASFGGLATEVKLLEMGAPVMAAKPAASAGTSDWVNLIGSAGLTLLLALVTLRRLLLLD